MTIQLIQKTFLKGTREFEIVDDAVFVRIKSLFREEKLTVGLSTLDPVPGMSGSELAFYSRNQGRPVLSLLLNKPDTQAFEHFVDTLKQHIRHASNASASAGAISAESARPEAPGWNVYEEPPEFEEYNETQRKISFTPVNPERLEDDISMLKTYLQEDDVRPLLDALEILRVEPQSEAAFQNMVEAFNGLGIYQGAVLTYAPYLKILLSNSIWS